MKLKVLCSQEYAGVDMVATPCTKCRIGWDKQTQRCTVPMGVEHLTPVRKGKVPACPIADRCRHQLQVGDTPCPVRARGLLCESAVGVEHPLTFNAIMYE